MFFHILHFSFWFFPLFGHKPPETTRFCIRGICLIVRLSRPVCWHFAVALGDGLVVKLQMYCQPPCPLFNTLLMQRCSLLYYAFSCAILRSCYQLSKLIPAVSFEFIVFLLVQSLKTFQDRHSEPKEVGFVGQGYSCSVWCDIKSWLCN